AVRRAQTRRCFRHVIFAGTSCKLSERKLRRKSPLVATRAAVSVSVPRFVARHLQQFQRITDARLQLRMYTIAPARATHGPPYANQRHSPVHAPRSGYRPMKRSLDRLPTRAEDGSVNVVVESPRRSALKFEFDRKATAFA